ncbi:restriction endonuclease [Enterobacter hormaechei]|uniref:restriction endonuclease n=2 Tax=Enterobacter hormaechei TaxID=158836 RepID=UPI00186731A3|nr:restriction endonuclease [Enterobacter hormaechei]MBT2009415.1 restriction endonuclease [Enterobacter hormaechei subsp. xiangfangensis]ELD3423818.1 restriction endonuclease [Enterobacter hormaechei]MBT2018158.1 restriction endonuclease [Enterobacter hormaechei subsp. xiangfangensis]MBT2041209.1 restriction endonuclease [Enterobacter hormaechei subsp. xiangfangensis]MDK3078106.1 restriction endonuclease [Enterobacter hormaechei]
MKSLIGWIIKNGWNLFSCVGVIATFYFSLIYVPGYVEEINSAKSTVTKESLVDNVQELLFYDKKLSINDVDSFIKGKTLEQNSSYPYTSDELLLQVQDRFMSNKFIPLEKRESLKETIKAIRSTYIKPTGPKENSFSYVTLMPALFSLLGTIAAAFGTLSLIKKIKIDKETEVDIVSSDISYQNNNSANTSLAFEFEKTVGEVLSELGVLVDSQNVSRDVGYDFEVKAKGRNYIVEVKYFRKLLGLGTARDFIYQVNSSGKGGILIVSSGVTERTRQFINEHNNLSDSQKVYLVIADAKQKLREKLQEILVS